MTDEAGEAAWSYDAMGRPVTERRTITGITKEIKYSYNFDGSVKELTYPHDPGATNPRKVTYAVGRAGRMLSAIDSNGVKYATNATYAPQGALASLKNGETTGFGGIVTSLTYNHRLQPKDIIASTGTVDANCTNTAGKIVHFFYNYNLGFANNGNVMNILNCRSGSRNQSFSYDDLNRLKTAGTPSTWGNSYVYDAWGNLLQKNALTQTMSEGLTVTVNVKNQMEPATTYGYDAAGNLTKHDTANYTYDAENRLLTAGGFTYTYDGDGKRVKKSDGTNGILYWTGMGADALAESNLQGGITDEYIFFNGKRVARRKSDGTVNYYFADHLGSSRVVTSATGGVLDDCDYFPFGGEVAQCGTASNNHYKFTDKERDSESGLDYFGARYFSSVLARFVTVDPLYFQKAMVSDPQRLNLYAYTRNNPLRYIDPSGYILRVAGETLAAQEVLRQLVGKFSNKLTFGENGTVAFNVTSAEIKGNAGAQLVYDLVNSPQTFIFFTGTSGSQAAALFQDQTGRFSRDQMAKWFEGNFPRLTKGGGELVGTLGRVGAAQPADGVFAVFAFNTDAVSTQIASCSECEREHSMLQSFGNCLTVPLIAHFIHEAAENLVFAAQASQGKSLDYAVAHGAAIALEIKIRDQIRVTGGYGGAEMETRAPRNPKP